MSTASRTLSVAALAVALLVGAGAAAAPNDAALDELLARLRAHPHRHDGFTERFTTAVLDRPVEASGELFFDAPDHLEKRTLKPRPERLVLDGNALTVERGKRTYHATLADYPQIAPYIDSIRATLAGDRAALERSFRIKLTTSGEAWTLLLTPAIASMTAELVSVRIEGTLEAIRAVTIERANGDRSVMTLTSAPTS